MDGGFPTRPLDGIEDILVHVVLLEESLEVPSPIAQHQKTDGAAATHSLSIARNGDLVTNHLSALITHLTKGVCAIVGGLPIATIASGHAHGRARPSLEPYGEKQC